MNIAVVNIRDIIKYAIKIGVVICIIYICMQLINGVNRQEDLKKGIENGVEKINNYSFLDCLDVSMSLFSYKKTDENKSKIISNQDILAMGAGILDESILSNTDLVIDENELTIDDAEELAKQVEEIPKDATTEAVQENNITPKVTGSYGSVKINNQSKYEITEDMLVPDAEITNKKDILIYHTHTCESYTPSPRI